MTLSLTRVLTFQIQVTLGFKGEDVGLERQLESADKQLQQLPDHSSVLMDTFDTSVAVATALGDLSMWRVTRDQQMLRSVMT